MADPTLKRTNVTIGYTGSDGYRFEMVMNQRHTDGPPQEVFLCAFEELSRLLHLFGFGAEGMERANEACERVNAFFAKRATPAPQDTKGAE